MMTLHDLYKAVSQLGFEDSLGDDSTTRFIYATNRALVEINALRPRRKRIDINHKVPTNLLFSEPCYIEKNKPLEYKAQGAKSFYFEVCGQGSVTIGLERVTVTVGEDGEKIKTVSIVGDTLPESVITFNHKTFTAKKGFIKFSEAFVDSLMESNTDTVYYTGNAVIKFTGAYDYTIRNLAMYDRVYSSDTESIIPYGTQVAYYVSTLADDFDKFDSFPVDSNGKHLTEGFSVENNTVYLPTNKQGIYTINYLHKVTLLPTNSDINSTTTTIDLDDDLAVLLPNLIAAYVWLDDEAEKSQYYYNLYMQRAEQIRRETVDLNPVAFESVYGW